MKIDISTVISMGSLMIALFAYMRSYRDEKIKLFAERYKLFDQIRDWYCLQTNADPLEPHHWISIYPKIEFLYGTRMADFITKLPIPDDPNLYCDLPEEYYKAFARYLQINKPWWKFW